MSKDDQVENRSIILRYISDNPGSHMRKISRDLGISLGTLRYHLDHLEKKGEISCQKQNNLKVYFLSGSLKPHERMLTPILQQKHYRDIILALIDSPGLTFSQIADKLSMGHSSASKYINILEDQEILFHKRSGREKYYFVNDEKSIMELMTTYKKFVADVSYEVRTPMNTIMGMTSLLLEGELTPEQRDFVEAIKISGEALIAMVNEFMDFSKMEGEKIELNIQTLDLHGCIEEAIDSVAPKAAEVGLRLAYIIDDATPHAIIGDPKKLHQLLISLLKNSIDLARGRGGDVLISASSDVTDAHCEIHFSIRDSGAGSSQEILPRFDAERQAISGADRPGREKLIARRLALSRKLVELMNGSLHEEGTGSGVHFTIKTKPAYRKSPLAGVQPGLSGKRILIIEGNKTNRYVLGTQSRQWGMISTAAGSYQEYRENVHEEDSFDIAVLDAGMPEKEMADLVKELRRDDAALPLIALVGNGQRAPDLFSASLTRPIKLSSFHRSLMSVMPGQVVSEVESKSMPARAASEAHVESRAPACPGPMSILVAEDNLSNQKVILAMLERLGYGADTATNGLEVLQALEHRPYDLIFMDVKMPLMDGIAATQEIRRRWPHGPKIVAVTAYAMEGDRRRCYEAGMDDYIAKPVQKGALYEAIKKCALESQ